MTIHTTRTCDGCGIELEEPGREQYWGGAKYLTVEFDFNWPPQAKRPSGDLPHKKITGPSWGSFRGQYCSWKCVRLMLDYIEANDTREWAKGSA